MNNNQNNYLIYFIILIIFILYITYNNKTKENFDKNYIYGVSNTTNFPGNEIGVMVINTDKNDKNKISIDDKINQCKATCDKDVNCIGFSTNSESNNTNDKLTCSFKNNMNVSTIDNNFNSYRKTKNISNYITKDNTDYQQPGPSFKVDNIIDCSRQCNDDHTCAGFTILNPTSKDNKICYLKNKLDGDGKINNNTISYIKSFDTKNIPNVENYIRKDNRDFSFNDISCSKNNNDLDCAKNCNDNNKCVGFAIVNPASDNNKVCCLKNKIEGNGIENKSVFTYVKSTNPSSNNPSTTNQSTTELFNKYEYRSKMPNSTYDSNFDLKYLSDILVNEITKDIKNMYENIYNLRENVVLTTNHILDIIKLLTNSSNKLCINDKCIKLAEIYDSIRKNDRGMNNNVICINDNCKTDKEIRDYINNFINYISDKYRLKI